MAGETYQFRKKGTDEVLPYNTRVYEKTVMVPTKVKQQLWNSQNQRLSLAELDAIGLEVLVIPAKSQAEIDFDHFYQVYMANPNLVLRVEQYKNYLDGLPPLKNDHVVVGTVASGNDTLSVPDLQGLKLFIGAEVTGDGIPADAHIVSYTATSITLDKTCDGNHADTNITIKITNYQCTVDDIRTALFAESLSETERLELAQNINATFHDVKVNYQAVAAAFGYAFPSDDFMVWNDMNKMVYHLPSNNPTNPERHDPYVLTEE